MEDIKEKEGSFEGKYSQEKKGHCCCFAKLNAMFLCKDVQDFDQTKICFDKIFDMRHFKSLIDKLKII